MSKQQSPAVVLLQRTCAWYSGISLFVLMVNVIFFNNENFHVSPLNFLLFFPFALCLSLATLVRRSGRLSAVLRIILHPALVLGGFALCVYLPSNRAPVVLAVAAAIYAITVLVVWLCNRGKRQKKAENAPYISQFGSKS